MKEEKKTTIYQYAQNNGRNNEILLTINIHSMVKAFPRKNGLLALDTLIISSQFLTPSTIKNIHVYTNEQHNDIIPIKLYSDLSTLKIECLLSSHVTESFGNPIFGISTSEYTVKINFFANEIMDKIKDNKILLDFVIKGQSILTKGSMASITINNNKIYEKKGPVFHNFTKAFTIESMT